MSFLKTKDPNFFSDLPPLPKSKCWETNYPSSLSYLRNQIWRHLFHLMHTINNYGMVPTAAIALKYLSSFWSFYCILFSDSNLQVNNCAENQLTDKIISFLVQILPPCEMFHSYLSASIKAPSEPYRGDHCTDLIIFPQTLFQPRKRIDFTFCCWGGTGWSENNIFHFLN